MQMRISADRSAYLVTNFSKEQKVLDGDKIKLDLILNQEITIIGYSIKKSKHSTNKSGDYLTVQFEMNGDKQIFFTGSEILIEQFNKYGDEIPFIAIVKKINRYYTLT